MELISKGVVGILSAETDSGLLKKAILSVASGGLWITRGIVKTALCQPAASKRNLTNQESKVASYICHGLRNKEIAQKLDISEQTVKSHCNRIYKKFGVTDRLQLALLYSKSSLK